MSAPVFLLEPGDLDAAEPGGELLLGGSEGRHAGVVQRRAPGERVDVVVVSGDVYDRALPHVDAVHLADEAFARQAVAGGVEYVLHQAAIPSVPRSVEDPITSNRANIDATLNVLVAARDAGVPIVISTDAHSRAAFGRLRWGVVVARRAWLEPGDVLNTLAFDDFRKRLRRNLR